MDTFKIPARLGGWATLGKIAVGAVALLGVVGIQRSQLNTPSLWDTDPQRAERQEAVRLNLIKQVPSFGFDAVVADWVFLDFLQYYGDIPLRNKTGYKLSPNYFDVITQRDPWFVDSYTFLSNSISYQLGEPRVAIDLMERGTKALSPQIHPQAFRVWRHKGLDQLLLLGDVPGAIRSHEAAAQWTKGIDDNLSELFQETANFLRTDPDSIPVRQQAWVSVYMDASIANDQITQKRAKAELEKLGARVELRDGSPVLLPLRPQAGQKPSQK